MPDPTLDEPTPRSGRRRFLGQASVAAGVAGTAWVTPALVSVDAAAAATPPAPNLVAVGQSQFPPLGPFAFHSSDLGDTWTGTITQPDGDAYAVAADGAGRFVAAGEGGSVAWTSPDAVTWTAVLPANLPPGFSARGLATDGAATWSAVSNTVDQGYYSTMVDGSVWLTATIPGTGFDAAAVSYSSFSGVWVAVGPGGAWRSTDAQTWVVAASALPADWNALAVAVDPAGLFVAVGPGTAGTGGAWLSIDGDLWTVAVLPPVGIPAAIAVGPGGWSAVGRLNPFPDPTGRSWTSPDGSTWTTSVTSVNTPGFGVATDGFGAWVAVGDGTRCWTSIDDGVNWIAAPTPISCIGAAVAFDRLLP
jgi:hypothetical protein